MGVWASFLTLLLIELVSPDYVGKWIMNTLGLKPSSMKNPLIIKMSQLISKTGLAFEKT